MLAGCLACWRPCIVSRRGRFSAETKRCLWTKNTMTEYSRQAYLGGMLIIVQETFNLFYTWIVNYDLVSQWTVEDGPFRYPYRWLSTAEGPQEMKEWAASGFARVFGEHPDTFEIL